MTDPRVVRIEVNRRPFNWGEPQRQQPVRTVAGSGFFIDNTGILVTNAHVVHEAIPVRGVFVQMMVATTSGKVQQKTLSAKIVGFVPDKDLAVLSVRTQSPAYFDIGDSDSVRVGDHITTMGYQLGSQELDVTQGAVSGFEHPNAEVRTQGAATGSTGRSMIQVDAATNSGSSGGPLVDNKTGKVVGIITSGIPHASNLSYATPTRHLRAVLQEVVNRHHVRASPLLRMPHLGFWWQPSNDLLDSFSERDISVDGVRVVQVFKGSFAERMGMLTGDTLLRWLGENLGEQGRVFMDTLGRNYTVEDLFDTLIPGTLMTGTVWRTGKGVVQLQSITYQHDDQPQFPIRFMYPMFEDVRFLIVRGLVIMQFSLNHISGKDRLNGKLSDYQMAQKQQQGVLIIVRVQPGSQADRHRVLRAGALIASINGTDVHEFNQAARLINKARGKLFSIETQNGLMDVLQ